MARARQRVEKSDLVLWLEPVTETGLAMPAGLGNCARIATKLDLAAPDFVAGSLAISAETGAGIGDLLEWLISRVRELAGSEECVLITRARQRAALRACAGELRMLYAELGAVDGGQPKEIELQAEHLRRAMNALGRLVGQINVEEVLGEIFAAFCIGK